MAGLVLSLELLAPRAVLPYFDREGFMYVSAIAWELY
jgi:hypothetical protein